jgi:hypothetical protein
MNTIFETQFPLPSFYPDHLDVRNPKVRLNMYKQAFSDFSYDYHWETSNRFTRNGMCRYFLVTFEIKHISILSELWELRPNKTKIRKFPESRGEEMYWFDPDDLKSRIELLGKAIDLVIPLVLPKT